MKILWISFYGSWTKPLLLQIRKSFDGVLGIVVPVSSKNKYEEFEKDGINYFSIPLRRIELRQRMSTKTFYKFNKIIKKISPDIIHVHGTEKNMAQIQDFISDIPIVISIQGIMNGCRQYSLNFLKKKDFKPYSSIKNMIGFGGAMQMEKASIRSDYELDILKKGKYFIGRTKWDKAHILLRNPDARYFHGEELLRSDFYKMSQTWRLKTCKRHSIFMPSGFNPIKGLHLTVQVVSLLKPFYPDIHLNVPGIPLHLLNQSKLKKIFFSENYLNFITHQITTLGIETHITFLPQLNAAEMAEQMQKANVFVSPSSIDNSPNAIGEAMMVGLPIVTTPVGGIPSFLKDEISCLFAPSGDPYLIAYQVTLEHAAPWVAFFLHDFH